MGQSVRLAVVRGGMRALFWPLQAVLLGQLLYLWIPAVAAIRRRLARADPAPPLESGPGVAVLIPAQNEAAVIGGLLDDLREQTYSNYRVYVVADNCTDDTAMVARCGGAICLERVTRDGTSTKLQALAELWAMVETWEPHAALILDADHRVPPDFIATLVACNAPVVQATFREDIESGTALGALDGLTRVVSHQLAEAGRAHLGLSAFLAGSGMLFERAVLDDLLSQISRTIVEDREWQLRLALEKIRIAWTDATWVRSAPVASAAAFDRQRGRWLRGRWQLVRHVGMPLLAVALQRGDIDLLDKLYDQVQPPRAIVGLTLGGLLVCRVLPIPIPGLWPASVLLGMTASFASYFLLGMRLAGARMQAYLRLASAPIFAGRMALTTVRSLFDRHYNSWTPTERS